MLDQYRRIKKEHTGNILFFRLGDFYEMFAEDAVEVSALLNLTLTSRSGVPMCGVPYHAAKPYIARLLKLGKKISVCEQLTTPGKNKVIERDVVEIITPGTTVDEYFLDRASSNYVCCVASAGSFLSFSCIDLSTGEFFAASFPVRETEIFRQELERLSVREILIQESLLEEEKQLAKAVYDRNGIVFNRWADWLFDPDQAKKRLEKQFGLVNLKSFGLTNESAEIISAGTLLCYMDNTSKSLLPHIKTLKINKKDDYLGIDESSQRNLELIKNLRDGEARFSLLEVMDQTRSAMGKRLLKRHILSPLRDLFKINKRLDMVEELYRDQGQLSKLRELLGKTPDLERLISRLAMDKAHGRDLLSVKNALACFQNITKILPANINFESEDIQGILIPVEQLQILLEKGICQEPSILINEGNLIKAGYDKDLDGLRDLKEEGRQYLEKYLEEERGITGISSLKIRYNRLIGYFFEVTKGNLSKVPRHFIRRQSITGGERYTTDRLASLESDINGASDRIVDLEKKLFLEICEEAKKRLSDLACAAKCLAELDVAQSHAIAASINGWTRPELNESASLEICEGRHPVVESYLGRGEYIPNDIILNKENDNVSFNMITGPNMAGKSTYLRSAALITIMAQAGSFVPASEARIGICDRIYCRVGASDNLARGESTFLVEMNETAFILNTATRKSIVIMDEVGRGTATNDGLSIAWAVSEELLNRICCRTLFATHFHELSLLSHPCLVNRSMEVLDNDGKIVFLRKLAEGPASESYGVHVAKLAGLREHILDRAMQIMELLKTRDFALRKTFKSEEATPKGDSFYDNQIDKTINNNKILVNGIPEPLAVSHINEIGKILKETDTEQITPLEALNLLSVIKKLYSLDETKTYGSIDQRYTGECIISGKESKPGKHVKTDDAFTPTLFDLQ
jgi:DNA mismatch repair protein MutS